MGNDIQKAWNFERPPKDYWFDDFWRWLNPCIAALLTAIIGFLVTMLLQLANWAKFGSTRYFFASQNYVAAYFVYVAYCTFYAGISVAGDPNCPDNQGSQSRFILSCQLHEGPQGVINHNLQMSNVGQSNLKEKFVHSFRFLVSFGCFLLAVTLQERTQAHGYQKCLENCLKGWADGHFNVCDVNVNELQRQFGRPAVWGPRFFFIPSSHSQDFIIRIPILPVDINP